MIRRDPRSSANSERGRVRKVPQSRSKPQGFSDRAFLPEGCFGPPASARLFLDLQPDRVFRSRTGGRESGCGQIEHQKVVIAEFGEIRSSSISEPPFSLRSIRSETSKKCSRATRPEALIEETLLGDICEAWARPRWGKRGRLRLERLLSGIGSGRAPKKSGPERRLRGRDRCAYRVPGG